MNVSGTTSQGIRDEFMQLLLTQLRNQDPLEPVKQQEFLGQLAQFATLEGIESLNVRFEDSLKMQQLTQGTSLIGSTVRYHAGPSSVDPLEGQVRSASVEGDRLLLKINEDSIPVSNVTSILSASNPIGRAADERSVRSGLAVQHSDVQQARSKLGLG